MKILVTGGAGYIGSVACEHLLLAGHDVVVFDNLLQGHREAVPPRAVFVQGDIADRAALAAALARHRPDAVMHFAARSIVGESMQRPFLYLGENVVNGLTLLEAALDAGVRGFILSSTASLFDHPDVESIDESAPIRPGSPYGESKYVLERMLAWLERTHGLRYACLRYFNAAGATAERGEDHDPETHLIPLVLQVALGRRPHVAVFGDDYNTPDGTCIRDYVHVSDLARAHILALEALDAGSRVYNVGSGSGFTVRQVLETARRITGHPIPAVMSTRRPGDVARLVANPARIRTELGWSPRFVDLEPIVETAWDWHRRHPQGYCS